MAPTDTSARIAAVATSTVKGSGREVNEDALLCLSELGMFGVVDGIGGKGAGDIASLLVVDQVRRIAGPLAARASRLVEDQSSARRLELGEMMEGALRSANDAVRMEREARRREGMAATSVLALITDTHANIAHVGDCRAYMLRDRTLYLLTEDHSLAMLRFRSGRLSFSEVAESPARHQIYEVLGAQEDVDVAVAEVAIADGDVLLLCSNGLHHALTDEEIVAEMAGDDLEQMAIRLTTASHAAGTDNVSVLLLRVGSDAVPDTVDQVAHALEHVFLFQEESTDSRPAHLRGRFVDINRP